MTVAAVLTTSSPAFAASTPNSCRYSYDTLYRDMPISLEAAATIVPDGRYPAPTEVVPGQTLRTSAGTAGVVLPEYLAAFGYAVGLLHPDRNDIPVQVWLAISATNTKERVQVVGPIAVTATTTIAVDPTDDNRFVSATPWQYTTPVIPALEWTAVGGPVEFAQAGTGQLPQLPVGADGALRTVTGSAVIRASFAGGVGIYMDCRPGHTTGIEYDFAGPTYAPGPATAFGRLAGPRNTSCLSSVGRQVSGPAANFPAGYNREIDPMRIGLSTAGAAPEYTVGTPYTLPAVTLDATLSPDTLATLRSVPGLVIAGKTYPADVWVTIAAVNTTEGAQTVRATTTYTPTAGMGPVTLPATTWTPTGAGPIQFTLGAPASAAAAGTALPYGAVYLALGTEGAPATLDCAAAAITVADATIPWSDAGRSGSAGRYAFTANPAPPAFAIATNRQEPPVDTAPTGEQPAPVPSVVPTPTAKPVVKVPAGRVGSSRLSSAGTSTKLKLSCPAGTQPCSGTVTVRSAAKLKLGTRNRTVVLTRSATYTIAAGKSRTVTLRLSADGRAALKRYRTIKAQVTLESTGGVTATRRLNLRRGR